ncbi:MAG: META domain-containing protein [Pseudorhodoplanes sp.]|nr:META domain-containing protein [Pseudorhodoplanes sp.]
MRSRHQGRIDCGRKQPPLFHCEAPQFIIDRRRLIFQAIVGDHWSGASGNHASVTIHRAVLHSPPPCVPCGLRRACVARAFIAASRAGVRPGISVRSRITVRRRPGARFQAGAGFADFRARGAAEIDLWCASGKGHAVIIENSITIVPISMQDNQCPPDRLRMDEELLNRLTEVTSWRWDGHVLVLVGPRPLRFRPASN